MPGGEGSVLVYYTLCQMADGSEKSGAVRTRPHICVMDKD